MDKDTKNTLLFIKNYLNYNFKPYSFSPTSNIPYARKREIRDIKHLFENKIEPELQTGYKQVEAAARNKYTLPYLIQNKENGNYCELGHYDKDLNCINLNEDDIEAVAVYGGGATVLPKSKQSGITVDYNKRFNTYPPLYSEQPIGKNVMAHEIGHDIQEVKPIGHLGKYIVPLDRYDIEHYKMSKNPRLLEKSQKYYKDLNAELDTTRILGQLLGGKKYENIKRKDEAFTDLLGYGIEYAPLLNKGQQDSVLNNRYYASGGSLLLNKNKQAYREDLLDEIKLRSLKAALLYLKAPGWGRREENEAPSMLDNLIQGYKIK